MAVQFMRYQHSNTQKKKNESDEVKKNRFIMILMLKQPRFPSMSIGMSRLGIDGIDANELSI